jgi:hypothetical protein
MSKLNEFITGLKTLLAEHTPAPPREYKFMKDGVTKEGVKVFTEAEDWAEGVEVFVEVEGQVQAAPNGKHILEDGTTIEVTDGKVVTVTKVEAENEMEQVIEQATAALSAAIKDKNDFATQLTAKSAEITKLSADHANAIAAKDAEIVALKAQVTTLSAQVKSVQDTPAPAAPAQKVDDKGRPATWAKMSTAERIAYNLENINIKPASIN